MALAERLEAGEPGANAAQQRGRGREVEDRMDEGEDEEQGDEEEVGRAKVVDLTLEDEEEEEEMVDRLR